MYKKIYILIFIFLTFILNSLDLTDGYKDIKLGMSKSQVEELLKNSPDFIPQREEILSIRIEPDTEIITVEGTTFIEIAYFHFNKDKLFQIFLKINEKKIGYYILLKRFTDKFGKPSGLEPKSAFWQNSNVKIVIEKPCTLKYIYLPIWNELTKTDDKLKNYIEQAREDFINNL
ncbi:MAG TPA: hypothetical protein PLE45_12120 [Spirochaetota bacterium]|nr:hypothetical protein [Spirochaetota bacterium]HOL58014.1 hypothetical protein [Spirochaetota bacterium]HPP04349.1 hypothetical protein [Spirochaetota bacterium]